MINRKKYSMILICVVLLTVALLSGCQKALPADSSGSVSDDGKRRVVTSFYPIYISTINITQGIDSVKVINLTPAQTGCLHDYQLKPKDLETLEQADAFIINGAGMEAFLDDVTSKQPGLNILDASRGIELLTDAQGEKNPHVWVSITAAMSQVRNITDGLALMDPKNAIRYKQNASLYLSKLDALRKKAASDLSSLKTRDIVTFHEAFPYFAKEFNLKILAVILQDPDTEPTAQQLEATIKIVRESGTKSLFTEPQYQSNVVRVISDATGAAIRTLDPVVTGESEPGAVNNYIVAMEKNIAVLKEALG